MRILSWTFGLVVAAVVVDFALSNRAAVLIGFWPLIDGLMMPVYLAVLLTLVIGMALGWGMTVWRGWRRRRVKTKEGL